MPLKLCRGQQEGREVLQDGVNAITAEQKPVGRLPFCLWSCRYIVIDGSLQTICISHGVVGDAMGEAKVYKSLFVCGEHFTKTTRKASSSRAEYQVHFPESFATL